MEKITKSHTQSITRKQSMMHSRKERRLSKLPERSILQKRMSNELQEFHRLSFQVARNEWLRDLSRTMSIHRVTKLHKMILQWNCSSKAMLLEESDQDLAREKAREKMNRMISLERVLSQFRPMKMMSSSKIYCNNKWRLVLLCLIKVKENNWQSRIECKVFQL